jgi:hypothetical protein
MLTAHMRYTLVECGVSKLGFEDKNTEFDIQLDL